MRSLIIVVISMIMFFPSVALSEPFLVSDWQPAVDVHTYVLDFGMDEPAVSLPQVDNGLARVYYDLKGIPKGTYTVIAKAVDKQGFSSEWSEPFTFEVARPGVPMKLSIEVNLTARPTPN
jgi:predicted phage tail protein